MSQWYRRRDSLGRVAGLVLGLVLPLLALAPLPRADVQFDGVDDRLFNNDFIGGFITGSTFTITLVVLSEVAAPDSVACYALFLLMGDNNGTVALGRENPSGAGEHACGYLYDGGDNVQPTPMTLGWHHVTLHMNAGTMTVLVDGVPSSPNGTGGLADVGASSWRVGGSEAAGFTPDRIAAVRIYNTAVDVTPYAASRLRRPERGVPTADWPLERCADGTSGDGVLFLDRSGNNRPLTGDDGADDVGLTCMASAALRRPMPIQ